MLKLFLLFVLLISTAVSYEITPISAEPTIFGDSPYWDSKTNSLYYTDIYNTNHSIFRYNYDDGRIYQAKIPNEDPASFIIPVKCSKNKFVVGVGKFVKLIKWNGKSSCAKVIRTLTRVELEPANSGNNIHIGRADCNGRLYFGTFRKELCSSTSAANASMYIYSKKKGTKRIVGDVKVSSGLAWNNEAKKLYFINSCKFSLDEYDWNPNNGEICNGKVAFNFDASTGIPTSAPIGLDVDRDGNLWVAMYNSSSVYKINPRTKEYLGAIYLPTEMIVNLAIGGPNLDTLFVTTASQANNFYTGALMDQPLSSSAGLLFMVKSIPIKGCPRTKVNMNFCKS